MKNQILPNGGISDPHFLRVHRNLRLPVRIGQLYRDDQQLQLKMYHYAWRNYNFLFLVEFVAKTMIGQKKDSFYPPKSEGNSWKTNILKSDFKFNDKDIVSFYETCFQIYLYLYLYRETMHVNSRFLWVRRKITSYLDETNFRCFGETHSDERGGKSFCVHLTASALAYKNFTSEEFVDDW